MYIEGRQLVSDNVKTEVAGRPGSYVFQQSGATAWVKSYDNGAILLGPLPEGELWTVFPGEAADRG